VTCGVSKDLAQILIIFALSSIVTAGLIKDKLSTTTKRW